MKKVICSFGALGLFVSFIGEANALGLLAKASANCRMKRGQVKETRVYDPATRKTIVTDQDSGLSYVKKNQEELKKQKAVADEEVAVLRLQNDRLEKQVIALRQAQQQQLENYGKELKRIATFCDQVQAFIK